MGRVWGRGKKLRMSKKGATLSKGKKRGVNPSSGVKVGYSAAWQDLDTKVVDYLEKTLC